MATYVDIINLINSQIIDNQQKLISPAKMRNILVNIADFANVNAAGGFINGGNAFGVAASVGLTDNNALDVKTNSVRRMRFFANGNRAFYDTTTDAGFANDFGTGGIRGGTYRVNNVLGVNPATTYHVIQRFNTGSYDGLEIVSGGGSGGYIGGFRVKAGGNNATTAPPTSFEFLGGRMRIGDIDPAAISGIGGSNAQNLQVYNNDVSYDAMSLMSTIDQAPLNLIFQNYADGGRWGPQITTEAVPGGGFYDSSISIFTQDNIGFTKANLRRALTVDHRQRVGIGLCPTVAPAVASAGVTFPIAQLQVMSRDVAYVNTLLQAKASQTADMFQVTNSSLGVLTGFTVDGVFKNVNMTTTQRNALTPADGWEIFNTTTGKKEVYGAGIWNACW